ncbi:MAG TPA: Stp1/IreP family PP2C-type Ser/Thr phosphatase [Deltaproteobacteria bacterium]|nr:Stp1/IreP family PP2C-type Ser/Thr phosphatase [Deltaproteobacteria bacterium]
MQQVLDMGQRATGILAYLHHHGVTLRNLGATNFLIQDGERVVLYDPDIREVHEEKAPDDERKSDVALLGQLLQRFVPVEAEALTEVLRQCASGAFETPFAFGRALEDLIRANLAEPSPIAAGMTDVGLARTLNEDNWGWRRLSDDMDLYVVADGMGGHDSGEVASQMAVETLCDEAFRSLNEECGVSHERVEATFDASFQAGNNGIKEHSEHLGNDMGTTMVAALVIDRKYAFVANVGDSRGYLVRGEMLHQITRDHSLVAKMVEQGRITEEEARVHPHSNILLRTVGTDYDVDIDIFNVDLAPGDRILLCSDGLWGEVEDAEIESIMNHFPNDHRSACRELVRAAHHGGGKDNVTVLIIGIPE